NFHYVDLTDRSLGRVPGPTTIIIEGYFNIIEEEWDNYVSDSEYTWREVADVNVPYISGLSDMGDDIHWLQNSEWMDIHRDRKIGGRLYICMEKRLIWFHLFKS
ncbi:MAG: hypothetical protein LBC73_08580, partial [Oscillospiraceae bacterium]|nr:hypothetical protein [Oscillospiraceae bacterium]